MSTLVTAFQRDPCVCLLLLSFGCLFCNRRTLFFLVAWRFQCVGGEDHGRARERRVERACQRQVKQTFSVKRLGVSIVETMPSLLQIDRTMMCRATVDSNSGANSESASSSTASTLHRDRLFVCAIKIRCFRYLTIRCFRGSRSVVSLRRIRR
jgi:hypothetical protein